MNNLFEIVMKLVGPVQPMGEHYADKARLENIKKLTELVDRLLYEIKDASTAADRPEDSMRAIGIHALDFLKEVKAA